MRLCFSFFLFSSLLFWTVTPWPISHQQQRRREACGTALVLQLHSSPRCASARTQVTSTDRPQRHEATQPPEAGRRAAGSTDGSLSCPNPNVSPSHLPIAGPCRSSLPQHLTNDSPPISVTFHSCIAKEKQYSRLHRVQRAGGVQQQQQHQRHRPRQPSAGQRQTRSSACGAKCGRWRQSSRPWSRPTLTRTRRRRISPASCE